jgi:hypothetical protein
VRVAAVIIGAATAFAWQTLVALFATSARGLFWRTVFAVAVAWVIAGLLLRFGDRGAAAGVGMSAAVGGCVAAVLVAVRWFTVGWPVW